MEQPEPMFTQKDLDEAVATTRAEAGAEFDKLRQQIQALSREVAEFRALAQHVAMTSATLAALIQGQAERRTNQ